MNASERQNLEFIQNVIGRMGYHGMFVKVCAVLLTTGLLLTVSRNLIGSVVDFLSILPIIVFWLLDGFFLFNERLYRKKYNNVRRSVIESDFNLDPIPCNATVLNVTGETVKASFSKTLCAYYGALVFTLVLGILYL